MTTPAEAAYEAYIRSSTGIELFSERFDDIPLKEQQLWTAIADAVIAQSKSIIAEEIAKVLMRSNEMSALMWYAGKRSSEQRLKDDGKRAAKALRAVITQQPASVHQS